MVKIIIDNNVVNMFTDEHIELKSSISQLTSLTSSVASFTQKFNVPASNNNNQVFKQYGILNIRNGINPHKAINCLLVIEETLTLEGVLEVNSVNFVNGEASSYAITFYGEITDLKTRLTNLKFNDTDIFSIWDSTITYTKVVDSWDGQGDTLYPLIANTRDYVYAIDKSTAEQYPDKNGNNIASAQLGPTPPLKSDVTGILLADLKPAYLLSEMIRLIFEEVNAPVTFSPKVVEMLAGAFVMPSPSAGFLFDSNNYGGVTCENAVFTPVSAYGQQFIDFLEVLDPGNNWNDTTNKYTAPINGIYSFEVKWNNYSEGDGTSFIQYCGLIRERAGATDTIVQRIYTVPEAGIDVITVLNVDLEAGDTCHFYFQFAGGPIDYPLYGHDITNTTLKTINVPNVLDIPNVIVKDQMPNMNAYQFISGWIKSWNLLPILNDDNSLLITDYETYYDNGESKDWSAHLDISKMSVSKTDVAKKYIFKHQTGKDRINTFFVENQARVLQYGEFQYFPDVDFGKEEEKIQSPFTVIPPSFMDNYSIENIDGEDVQKKLGFTDLPLHPQMNENHSPVQSDFLLFYYNHLVTPARPQFISYPYYLQESITAGGEIFYQTMFTFPYITEVQDYPSQSTGAGNALDSLTMSYGDEYPLGGEVAPNNLFNMFFDDFIQRMVDGDTRMITLDGLLPIGEYVNFKFSDNIQFQGITYVVQDIAYDFLDETIKLTLMSYDPEYFRWDKLPMNADNVTVVCANTNDGRCIQDYPYPAQLAESYNLQLISDNLYQWKGGVKYDSGANGSSGNILRNSSGGGEGYHKYKIPASTFAIGDALTFTDGMWQMATTNDREYTAQGMVIEIEGENAVLIRYGDLELPAHGYTIDQWYYLQSNGTFAMFPDLDINQLIFFVKDENILQINIERPLINI